MSDTVSPPADSARTADLFTPERRGLTIGLVATITLVAMESLAIGTVMPTVAGELGDLGLYGWVYSAFFLGSLIGIVVSGGLLDRWPLHRPFAAGLTLFALGLALGGAAQSMPMLVVARFIQGLGGGAVPPTAYVAIGRLLPDRLQPKMFAIMSAAWVAPGIIGPSLAALVGGLLGWRWVFLGLIPFLVVAGGFALSALYRLPGDRPAAAGAAPRATALRRLGVALLAAAGAGIVVAALDMADLLPLALGLAVGLALLLPAYRWLTPPGTLRLARGVPAAVFLRGMMTFSFFIGDAYIALLLQTWRERPLALTGVVFTITTLAWSVGTWIQSRRIDRLGPSLFIVTGFAGIAVGSLLTAAAALPFVPPEVTIVTWTITGVGMGLMYSAVTLVVLRGAGPGEQGSASSALQLSDILGTALGTGVGGAIIAAGERSGASGLGPALGAVFIVSVVVGLAGMAVAGRVRRPGTDGIGARRTAAAAVD
ncbi:MAG: MFS transporter [Chloroflexota bacterium]